MHINCNACVTGKAKVGILLLLLSLSTAEGLLLHDVNEGENFTLQWNISTRTELSSIHIVCLFKPTVTPLRRVFDMVGGVEMTGQLDSQFSGRVHCDREGLTRGQVQILLTGLGPQDSGHYMCETASTTDKNEDEVMSKDFVINVPSSSDSAAGNLNGELHNEDSKNQTDTPKPRDNVYSQNTTGIATAVLIIFIIMGLIIWKVIKIYRARKQRQLDYVPCETTAVSVCSGNTSSLSVHGSGSLLQCGSPRGFSFSPHWVFEFFLAEK